MNSIYAPYHNPNPNGHTLGGVGAVEGPRDAAEQRQEQNRIAREVVNYLWQMRERSKESLSVFFLIRKEKQRKKKETDFVRKEKSVKGRCY